METLFKKHFWVINVVGLGLAAFLLASAFNAWLGAKMLASGGAEAAASEAESSDGSLLSELLAKARLEQNAAGVLATRRPFLLEEPPPPAPPPEDKPADGADVGPPEESYADTELPIQLLGTVVARPEEYSVATLKLENKETKIVRVGSKILDDKAEVYGVARRYVVLKQGNVLKIARLWAEKKDGAPGAPRPGAPAQGTTQPPARSTQASGGGSDLAGGVRKTGDTAYQIDRGMLNKQLQDLTALGQQARVVPNYHNGKYEGFRLVGIQPASLYQNIGFQSGDIVKSINGNPIDSPNKALSLFETLKAESKIQVQVERQGQVKTLSYTIQ